MKTQMEMEQNKNCKKGCDLKGNRSHDNGGIDAIVDDAGKTVEVESMEYIVCEKAVNDPNIHEYKGTNLQVVKAINKSGGGVDATVTDADGKIVIETGQVVINKKSLSDNTVRSFKGTNKQILSQINQSMGNGVAIYENGGQITKGSTITYKGNEFEVIGASTGKLKAYLVKDKNGVESVIMDNQLHNDKYSEGGSIMEIKSTIHTGNKRVKAGELQIAYFKNSDFPYKNKKVSSSKDAYDICKDIFSKNTIELQESFYALYLNRRNEIIAYEEISKGGTAGTVIDNKIILSIALKVLASGIIIAHNHPSENLNPSDSDINISKKLKSAATYMDISLLDSLIITNDGYYSLADEGQLYKYGGAVNGYGYEDLSQKESDVVYENGGEVEGKSLKDEVIYFFQKNNVDVDKLRFKYSKQSRFEKNRYKNPEEEVWVFLNDKKYTRRGKELETSFVLTRTEFESYKKAGKSGVDLLIYGNQLPLLKNQMQEHLQGGLSDNKTILDISKKHNVSLDFANEQLEKGILVELEHTDNRDIASEIALDHLSESINYYIELEKMEDKLKDDNDNCQNEISNSNIVNGKMIESNHTTIYSFNSAFELNKFLESIPSKNKSLNPSGMSRMFKDGGEVVNDKYYALSFGNYIQVKFVENLSIQGLDLFLYKDDGYFGIADEKTGVRIGGGAKEKDRAIDNADNFIQNHGKEKVIEYLKNAQLSPRYSKETKTFEESQFDKIKDLYESKDFKKLYEIISNNVNTTSRKALSQILERSIVNYNKSQINDLFLEFGYDIRKINLENERIKKQKDAELKQSEIDKQNEYKKTEYPYLDLSNMSPKQFAILDKAMQKLFRYALGVMRRSKYIKTIKDDIIGITSSKSEYGRNGELRAAPLTEYFYQTKDKFLHSIPKLAYDNWIGFKNENELKEYLQGGISDGKTTFDIANKHDADESYVEEQIDKGIKIEREHTDNDIIAEEIARDHLWEHIDYYEELEKMEEKLKNIKRASKYSNEELTELCKQADINKETLVFDVPDDKIEYYKSLGFVIKNENEQFKMGGIVDEELNDFINSQL